jgi:hypothetical protein
MPGGIQHSDRASGSTGPGHPGQGGGRGLPVISSAAGGFAHLFGSAATGIGARMLGQGTKIARTQTDAAAEGIRRALGRGYADPGEMARLMRLDAPYRPTVGARATIAGSRAGLYGAQGFLAGERTSRYR